MKTLYKRRLKGELLDLLTSLGFVTTCTDTPALVFFTDRRVSQKSVPNMVSGKQYGYITSFGVKTAQKMLEEAKQ